MLSRALKSCLLFWRDFIYTSPSRTALYTKYCLVSDLSLIPVAEPLSFDVSALEDAVFELLAVPCEEQDEVLTEFFGSFDRFFREYTTLLHYALSPDRSLPAPMPASSRDFDDPLREYSLEESDLTSFAVTGDTAVLEFDGVLRSQWNPAGGSDYGKLSCVKLRVTLNGVRRFESELQPGCEIRVDRCCKAESDGLFTLALRGGRQRLSAVCASISAEPLRLY